MKLAPIAVFCYDRPDHLKKTIDCLVQNPEAKLSDLYIFSDAPRNQSYAGNVHLVRKYLKDIIGFKSIRIFENEKNLGLASSLVRGITKVLKSHDKIIVIEDDLMLSRYFLSYMNRGLDHFQSESKVFAINGYSRKGTLPSGLDADTYFVHRAFSWGWGTWKDRWDKSIWEDEYYKKELRNPINTMRFAMGGGDLPMMLRDQLRGKFNAWSIKWCYIIMKHEGICLTPRYSYVSPNHDSKGTHVKERRRYFENDIELAKSNITYPDEIDVLLEVSRSFSLLWGSLPEVLMTRDELLEQIHVLKLEAGLARKWREFKILSSERKWIKIKSHLKTLMKREKNSFNQYQAPGNDPSTNRIP